MNDSRQQGYQSSNDTQNGFESSYKNENPYQKANPYETNMNNNYNNTNPYGNNGGNGQSYLLMIMRRKINLLKKMTRSLL